MSSAIKATEFSTKAKLKARMLYYSFALSSLNSLYLILANKGDKSVQYIVLTLNLIMLYKFRPSNISVFVRNLEEKNIIPMKSNTFYIWIFVFAYTILEQVYQITQSQVVFNSTQVVIILISFISLLFIADKEIRSCIWKKK